VRTPDVLGRLAYGAVCLMAVRGEPCDPITVGAELDRRGELARVGGAAYLHTLVEAVPTAANGAYYADRVRDLALLRGVIEAGTRVVQLGYAADGDPQEIAERAVADMQAARDRGLADRDAPPLDLTAFLAQADDEPDWVIPGMLARWDRLMVTAGEGGGKLLWLCQVLMRAAAGLYPFKRAKIRPVKALLVDVENSADQARPWRPRRAGRSRSAGSPWRSRSGAWT
jgi:DnaB helicase-like protein/AAA domain-containing protein